MLEKIRATGVRVYDNDGALFVAGNMTALQRRWLMAHAKEILAALAVEETVCATCGHVIQLGVEDWQYRDIDAGPLCQACCERTEVEMAKWRAMQKKPLPFDDPTPTTG